MGNVLHAEPGPMIANAYGNRGCSVVADANQKPQYDEERNWVIWVGPLQAKRPIARERFITLLLQIARLNHNS